MPCMGQIRPRKISGLTRSDELTFVLTQALRVKFEGKVPVFVVASLYVPVYRRFPFLNSFWFPTHSSLEDRAFVSGTFA